MIQTVSREAVLAAMAECDRLGRARFLAVHGYWSGAYQVRRGRATYDSKAIMGVAAGIEHDCEPLPPSTFSGGLEHAVRRLVLLGFEVRRRGVVVELDDIAIPDRFSLARAPELRLYVCRPTSERSIAACHEHDFGALVSPLFVRKNKSGTKRLVNMAGYTTPLEGLPYVIDNGAWACHQTGDTWSDGPMIQLLERLADRDDEPRWAVLPDIVGGGVRSLDLSLGWHAEHRELAPRWLLAVQNGMTPALVRPHIESLGLAGIFVGGSREWKWSTLEEWAELGIDLGCIVHVGRVNGERKARRCRSIGVSSIDGSSVASFSVNATKMARPCDGDDTPVTSHAGRTQTRFEGM